MSDDDVQSAVAQLLAGRPEHATRDEVAATLEVIRRLRSRLAAIEVGYTRRARQLADSGQSEPPESLLGAAGGMDTREADTAAAREELCDQAADVEDALAQAELTTGHADAMAAARSSLPEMLRAIFLEHEERLLAAARTEPVHLFRKRCRQLARTILAAQADDGDDELTRQRKASTLKRWVDKTTGMHHALLSLDPERDAKVWSAISRTINQIRRTRPANEQRQWQEIEVEAAVTAITSNGGHADHRPVPEVQVLIDLESLHQGLQQHGIAETVAGTPLPVASIRRMCCEADVVPTVLDGDGQALDVGRAKRTATTEQRQALAAMHATCAHPGCTMPFDSCRIHHVDWWTRDVGGTDLDNLLPLCERHHHQVHEGG
ncbi:MAG: HNH endonuclease signature motif containing protein [Actinomycetota bacterium]